jgi:hypothetical protein
MFGTTWLAYFEGNARSDRAPGPGLCDEVPAALRARLAVSLGRFQLGESAGGRIHQEIPSERDRALDAPARRSIQLYIEEEWRHSRELAQIVRALGGELQTAHWTNGAFTACRRILGLRTKMMTLAIAEVIGIVYYRALASGVGSDALAVALRRIANEESRHLDFQAAFFERALLTAPRALRRPYRFLLRCLMFAIMLAAFTVLWLDHARVLRAAGAERGALWAQSWHELRQHRLLEPRNASDRRECAVTVYD